MEKFKSLSKDERKSIDELLNVADTVLSTPHTVIKGNPQAATVVGMAIGGAAGAALLAGAGVAGAGAAGAGVAGGAAFVAGGAAAAAAPVVIPVVAIAATAIGIGAFIGSKEQKKKEEQLQSLYCKKLAEKIRQITDKYEAELEKLKKTGKQKDDIIKSQQEKIAEYELMLEALKKQYESLARNLKFA